MNIAQDIKKMVVNREFMWFLLTLMQNAFNQASCVCADIRSSPLFSSLPWDNLLDVVPNFEPAPSSETDTEYFEPRNQLRRLLAANQP